MADPLAEHDSAAVRFHKQVEQRGPFEASDDADRVIRATLDTLAQAVSSAQLDSLIAPLPQDLQPYRAENEHAKPLDMPEFLDRVGGYSSSVEPAVVERQVRAVLSTIADWQPSDETVRDTLAQLPPQLADLFSVRERG